VYRYTGTFENGTYDINISIDATQVLVNTFAFTPAASANINASAIENGPTPSDDLPAGVAEEDIIVNKGGEYPLYGKLTYPARTQVPIPVVVLVHGSGANDMDETAYENKPFKDIAYALSQQGIAVLRYNKMTYAYPKAFARLVDFTVDQETVNDAVAAKTALEEQSAHRFSSYYVAGHSLGGMMAPRIAVSGGYDGMIILAGSLRSLEDIMIEQYRYLIPISGLQEADAKALLDEYEASYAEAKSILALPEAEQAGKTAFGQPALYFNSISSPDRTEALVNSGLPTLVLQGGKDYQVSAERDFVFYQELAKKHRNIECVLYENLNHLFAPSTMEVPDGSEYMTPAHVDTRVTDDIIRWILAQ
jgi:alpha-beta hydrolase superfamily lysophospholipase